MTLIETAKLAGLNPETYLADVLAPINDHLVTRLDELLPWNWTPYDRATRASRVKMAAITRAFTLARVADLLGEDEDWLHEISIEMEPEDGIIALYGLGEEATPAFTDFGIENLRQLVQIHKDNAARMPASPSSKSPPRP